MGSLVSEEIIIDDVMEQCLPVVLGEITIGRSLLCIQLYQMGPIYRLHLEFDGEICLTESVHKSQLFEFSLQLDTHQYLFSGRLENLDGSRYPLSCIEQRLKGVIQNEQFTYNVDLISTACNR